MTTEDNELIEDRLRAALGDVAPMMHLNAAAVLRQGRRIRSRRRLAVGGATLGLAVTVAAPAALSMVGGSTPALMPADAGSRNACSANAIASDRPSTAAASPSRVSGSPAPTKSPMPIGEILPAVGDRIRTGEAIDGGELVLWFGQHESYELTMGVGCQAANGSLALYLTIGHRTGTLAPGFHAMVYEPAGEFIVGYVVGDVARVVVTGDGVTGPAKIAKWSKDGSVSAVWFPVDGFDARTVHLTAYDANGNVLSAGNQPINRI